MNEKKPPVKSSYQAAEEAIDAAKHDVPWEDKEEELRKKRWQEDEEHRKKLAKEQQEQMDALLWIACL